MKVRASCFLWKKGILVLVMSYDRVLLRPAGSRQSPRPRPDPPLEGHTVHLTTGGPRPTRGRTTNTSMAAAQMQGLRTVHIARLRVDEVLHARGS